MSADVIQPGCMSSHASAAGDLAMHVTFKYDKHGRLKRPLSTPASFRARSGTGGKMNRPKTAAAVLSRAECERVLQLEHEPTRRQNFENHLGTKRSKPPPWQKNLDSPLVPFVIGPGYILSKNKSKFAVTLKDEFFDPVQDEINKKKSGDPERDSLISQLQQQISDLTLYLEEERLNHRQTKQKAEEFLRDKVEEIQNQHTDHIRDLEEEHEDKLKKQKLQLEGEFNQYKASADNQIHRMVKEIEFLQGAFDSYKSTLHQETDEKWHKKEDDLRMKYEEEKQTAVHELKTKMIQEKNADRILMAKDHHKQVDTLRKEHKKELDALTKRFSNAAADLERLKKTTAELEETKLELDLIKNSYNETCQQLANTTRLLTDTKVKLLEYEEQFQEKVQGVDDKYAQQLHDLMTQNTELRRMYVKKCGELFDEKATAEKENSDKIESAKEAMLMLIKAKERSNVNLTATNPMLDRLTRKPKIRPSSAPTTRDETNTAHLSAGETDHLLQPPEFIRPQTVNLPQTDPELEKLREEFMSQDVIVFTKEQISSVLDS